MTGGFRNPAVDGPVRRDFERTGKSDIPNDIPKLIPVYRGATLHGWAEVDERDYHDLVHFLWKVLKNGYVKRNLSGGGFEFMHRRILGLTPGDIRHADHIDGNPLNNTRANLRAVTQAENNQNIPARGRTSKHRGVCWVAAKNRWRAAAQIAGRTRHIGYFDTELDAAHAAAEFRRQHMPFANPARDTGLEEDTPQKEAA